MTTMFHKFPAACNFTYPEFTKWQKNEAGVELISEAGSVVFEALQSGTLRIYAQLGRGNEHNYSRVSLYDSPAIADVKDAGDNIDITSGDLEVAVEKSTGSFCISYKGRVVTESLRYPFGYTGERQIVLIDRPKDKPVYGLGSKTGALNKANNQYTFWNTDVVADHRYSFGGDEFDPGYVSIPVYFTKYKKDWYGIFLNNMGRTYIQTGLKRNDSEQWNAGHGLRPTDPPCITMVTESGELDLYFFAGEFLSDVSERYTRLTGAAPMPPRWALGYHQCRWSYESPEELNEVVEKLQSAKIPVSAIWMDIDYMDKFKVFTFNKKTFSKKKRQQQFKKIKSFGTRIVTIVDPGVKVDNAYSIYTEGVENDLFCKTEEGAVYTGNVWPGRTAFPDFTKSETVDYWADHTASWLDQGIDGIWIDMNDPSTGGIDYQEMRFQDGNIAHNPFHNQYADLMARSTVQGFETHDPERRPFVLTRSACAGTQNYAAVWTGDNVSNETHLRMSIPQSINLSLSGVSFNGPDVGGFFGDCSEELLVTWTLAGAMFPFFRNHSCIGTRRQEPYAYSKKALRVIRDAINTRAKLLPYIYTCFAFHARQFEAVMRPVNYLDDHKNLRVIDDQYMIGRSLMVAPFVDLQSKKRDVVLPEGYWYDMANQKWVKGGRTISVKRSDSILLFVEDGAILPVIDDTYCHPQPNFSNISFHVFQHPNGAGEAIGYYYEDDGETQDYQAGHYNLFSMMSRFNDGQFDFHIESIEEGYSGKLKEAKVYFYGAAPDGAKTGKAKWPFASHDVLEQRWRRAIPSP